MPFVSLMLASPLSSDLAWASFVRLLFELQRRRIRQQVVERVPVEHEAKLAGGNALDDPILADHGLDQIGRRPVAVACFPIDGAGCPHALRPRVERGNTEAAEEMTLIGPLLVQLFMRLEADGLAALNHENARMRVE